MEEAREKPQVDDVLFADGESCSTLTPLIKARMRQMDSGQVLEVRTDDPSALDGIPAWSRLTGDELLGVSEEEGQELRFFLRKR